MKTVKYLGLTEDYRIKFEKDGVKEVTKFNLGQLKTKTSTITCTKINSKQIGPRDIMIFKRKVA